MSITRKIVQAGILALGIGALLFANAAPASASTLHFDDISTPNCGTLAPDLIPTLYGGFTWDANLGVECDSDYMNNSGNTYGAPSNPNAIYNQAGITSEVITRATKFDFDGAKVAGWSISDSVDSDFPDFTTATSITIKGFLGGLGGTLVGTQTLTLDGAQNSAALGYLDISGISGDIDTLQITTPVTHGGDGNFWLLDDFQYHVATTAVPEPASVILLGSSLVGLLALRRRKA